MKTIRIVLTAKDPKYFWIRLVSLIIAVGASALAAYAISLGRRADANPPTSIALKSSVSAAPTSPSDSTARAIIAPASSSKTPTQGASVDKRGLHTITFTLYDAGIEPDIVHTRKGLVAIVIEDYSGGTNGLVVERETGSGRVSVGQVNRSDSASVARWRGRQELVLNPGTYRVHDSSRPANLAQIVVEH